MSSDPNKLQNAEAAKLTLRVAENNTARPSWLDRIRQRDGAKIANEVAVALADSIAVR